jgi:transcriptional regulator with PAS, ATPase and Fis domain
MFGYERGAFTGADTKRLGRFELAHSGTLFLDQVFDISLSNQAKLLNALEDNEMWPIGSVRPTPIDVRVIAATNVPLRQLVDQGAFRQDLYQRLKVVVINLPPLKQRLEDIVVLARFFVTFFGLKEKKHEITNISGKCWEMLIRYPWPGNVRELKNTIHNAVIFASGPMLLPEHMVFDPVTGDSETSDQLELQLYRDFSPRKLQSRVKDLKRIIQTTTWKGVCSNKLAAHFHVGKRQAQRLLKPLKSQNLFSFK